MSKKGFTLVEILMVILILTVISLITVPIVGKIIEEKKHESVYLDAKVILREIGYETLNEEHIPKTLLRDFTINTMSLENYDIDRSYVYSENDDLYIVLYGKNKFKDINACNIKLSSNDSSVGRIDCD